MVTLMEKLSKDLDKCKETLYGDEDHGQEGLVKQFSDLYKDFIFYRRIWKVLAVFLTAVILAVIGISIKYFFTIAALIEQLEKGT